MKCRDLDNWELESVLLGDDAVVEVHDQLSPTRTVNGVWW
jgi:hypothetical protein